MNEPIQLYVKKRTGILAVPKLVGMYSRNNENVQSDLQLDYHKSDAFVVIPIHRNTKTSLSILPQNLPNTIMSHERVTFFSFCYLWFKPQKFKCPQYFK